MQLPKYAVRLILIVIFFVAVGARFASVSGSMNPYFKGPSATTYRHAMIVAGEGDLDAATEKSNWPDGYTPARVMASGTAQVIGRVYAVAQYFTEMDGREFTKKFVVWFFCLNVFLICALATRTWGNQGSGLLAAGVVALSGPLIAVSNGHDLPQLAFSSVFWLGYLVALTGFLAHGGGARLIASGLLAFLALFSWDLGPYAAAIVLLAVTMWPGITTGRRRAAVTVSFIVFAVTVSMVPYFQATATPFSWSAALALSSVVIAWVPALNASRARAWGAAAAGTVLITAALTPARFAAAATPVVQYAWHRIRFAGGKPGNPAKLPETVRHIWDGTHAAAAPYALIDFFVPVLVLLPAVWFGVRAARQNGTSATAARVCVAVAVAAAVAFAVDRSAVIVAVIAACTVAAAAAVDLPNRGRTLGAPVAVGLFLIAAQAVFPLGILNGTYQIARAAGVAHQDPDQFLWVSLEHTDRELIRFTATRTSVADPVLARPDVGALLLAFSGRTAVLLDGPTSTGFAEKHVAMMAAYYGTERELVDLCQRRGIRYVLYSIDMVLDRGPYGPPYLAGLTAVPEESAAMRMHFRPQSLRNLNLVYENEHYRLFQVVREFQPVFVTDHPPVYHLDLFDRVDRDVDRFNRAVVEIMLTYSEAQASQLIGDHKDALTKLNWCVNQAPYFTDARVATAKSLLALNRLEEARNVLLSVLNYAPDNPEALYQAAYTLTLLDEFDRAKSLLTVLEGATRDSDILSRANALRAQIERGETLTPGIPPIND